MAFWATMVTMANKLGNETGFITRKKTVGVSDGIRICVSV